ncbi:MAG TPA: protein kinase [Polyangium sp.]|nr:protein kinase [Polyangium sp.]
MSSDAQDVPERLGRYEILERLASGGMGEVFVGRFVGPGGFIKPVAVKRIHPHLAGDEAFIHMLHDEANVAAAIRHPNIIATIDVGSEGSNHFVVLDYCSGDSLSRLLRDQKKRGKAFPDWLVAWIGAETASALHAAHEAKSLTGESLEIIHRDVSLSNVLLSDAGHPMLFDFGVAKAAQRMTQTTAGELKGKLPYMAPETFRGAPIDRTVDIFSLGVMLYEMATAISPFARGSDIDTITALQGAIIDPPSQKMPASIPPSLDPIIMRAMARERHDRYATAATVEQDLRAWARARGAPHDAATAAAWLLEHFPERTSARKALLARIANAPSGSFSRSSQPMSTRSVSGITPFPTGRSSPSYDRTQALVGHTPAPVSHPSGVHGLTPAPYGQTPPPRGEISGSYDHTQAMYGATPVPHGQTPPPRPMLLTDPLPQPGTDSSIPGVGPVDTKTSQPNFMGPPPPAKSNSLHVMLGLASTLAIGAIVVLVIVLSKDKPEATTTSAADGAQPVVSVQPVAAPTNPPPVATEPAPVANTSATATTPARTTSRTAPRTSPAPAPQPTATSKKGGPLVRSYD